MAYQVTARKWRPRQFDEVVGQEHITATLKSAVHSGRIAQCYLVLRASRRGQNHDRADSRQGPQLRRLPRRQSLRGVRFLPEHRHLYQHERAGDRRGLQQ